MFDFILDILYHHSIANSAIVLSIICCIGMAAGAVKYRGIGLGIAGVLFAGVGFGHLGLTIIPEHLAFAQDFGLIIFVFAVGAQVGPGFISSLKKRGRQLLILASLLLLSGFAVSIAVRKLTSIPPAAVAGIMTGAVTSTPSIGAAQQVLAEAGPSHAPLSGIMAAGYAITYPMGVFMTIFAIFLLRKTMRIDVDRESREYSEACGGNAVCEAPVPLGQDDYEFSPGSFLIFLSIITGVIIGSIALRVPALPVPLKFGAPGGVLVASILMFSLKWGGKVKMSFSPEASVHLREMGLALFLSCVGLKAGENFFSMLRGPGLYWLAWSAVITVIPVYLTGFVAKKFFKVNFHIISGLLSGSMTNSSAFAFASSWTDTDAPASAYAITYPVSMLIKIILAQIFVMLFVL